MGPRAAGRRALDRRPPGSGRRRPTLRRGGRRPAPPAVEEQIERGVSALFTTGRLYDDGIIDPRDSRTVLGIALSACHSAAVRAAATSASSGCSDDPQAARSPTAARSPGASRAPAARMGIATVAVYSEADARALRARGRRGGALRRHRRRDRTCASSDSRGRPRSGADAVHPGYGFLAENADFARAVRSRRACLCRARRPRRSPPWAQARGQAPLAAGGAGAARLDGGRDDRRRCGARRRAGLPALVKAAPGAAARDALVRRPRQLAAAVHAAARGSGGLRRRHRLPRTLPRRGRHVEVQVFGDRTATVVHLFERECSIQRRYQKLLEEAPSVAVDEPAARPLWRRGGGGGQALGLRRRRHGGVPAGARDGASISSR
ncbi:MAG: hypothetical protein KatS3mg131_2710 [Candidatus Tectimicrobiota bacterium]|nr:MAG: hypothetical protein KatS3mg131_2710 [Candidatus Tectomicrobia bacterium]